MSVKVLIVDDSAFFRRRVSDMLQADARFKVVGVAVDGSDAIEKSKELKPDVITMDIEMPVMDGITAVRKIMTSNPVPILMFSSLTREGAKATFDALEAGAVDYLPKEFAEISKNPDEVARTLRSRVWNIGIRGLPKTSKSPISISSVNKDTKSVSKPATVLAEGQKNKLIVIGASTGGPVALQKVIEILPSDYPVPVLMVQHMPESFTGAFAERLNGICEVEVREAIDGDELKPGLVLLAPGGKQILVKKRGSFFRVVIQNATNEQTYKPCIDMTLKSVAEQVGGNCTAIILTGMGADGRDGAKLLKEQGGTIWAQDEQSSVIYGMPMAVKQAGIADKELSLNEIGPTLLRVAR